MNKKGAALIALAGFGTGVFVGNGFAAFGIEAATVARVPAAAAAALPAGHPPIAERDLADVVTTTLQMGVAPAVTAMMPRTVSVGETPDLIAQADELRRQRRFDAAAEAYRRAAAAGVMTADAWADYADTLASGRSSLKGPPAQALEQALALDPRHPKALWLKASLQHEEHHYRDAVSTWRNLLAVVPANSSDARIIEANIAEATRLAASQG